MNFSLSTFTKSYRRELNIKLVGSSNRQIDILFIMEMHMQTVIDSSLTAVMVSTRPYRRKFRKKRADTRKKYETVKRHNCLNLTMRRKVL